MDEILVKKNSWLPADYMELEIGYGYLVRKAPSGIARERSFVCFLRGDGWYSGNTKMFSVNEDIQVFCKNSKFERHEW